MGIRSVFDGGELRREVEKSGIDPKFIPKIWKHILISAKDEDWDWEKQVPSLPSSAYSLLRSNFKTPLSSSIHSVFHSADNLTTKLLIQLHHNHGPFVEAVIMRYDTRLGKYAGQPRPGGLRATLCISSQVTISFFSFLFFSFLFLLLTLPFLFCRLDAKWVAISVPLDPWDSKTTYHPVKLWNSSFMPLPCP